MLKSSLMWAYRGLARIGLSPYDPLTYWNKRGDPNTDAGRDSTRVAFDANYIRKNVAKNDSVFELGPGVGRTFSSYNSGTRIITLDLSRTYKEKLASVAAEANLTLEQHFLDEASSPFPFDDAQFDVGVCFQVFIHQPPELFEFSFAEFARICKKGVVCSGLHGNTMQDKSILAPHCFRHDYISSTMKCGKIISNLLVHDGVLYLTFEDDSDNRWMLK